MSQLSLTINGDAATLRRILSLLDETPEQPLAGAPWPLAPVRKFVRSLNTSCREAVASIAARSTTGHPTSRGQLISESSNVNDDAELNGVIGTIGRRWREAFPTTDNPFQGRRIAAHADEWFYVLPQNLAADLQRELASDADDWRANLQQPDTASPA